MKKNIEYPKTIKKMVSTHDKKNPFLKYNKLFKATLWIVFILIAIVIVGFGLFIGGVI